MDTTIDYRKYEEKILNNSEGMFMTFPTWHGRIRRLEFGIVFIIYFVLYVIVRIVQDKASYEGNDSMWWFWWFINAVLSFLLVIQAIKRSHDMGDTGWYVIIPFYILALLFVKGDKGINRFGSDPKQPYGKQIDEMLASEQSKELVEESADSPETMIDEDNDQNNTSDNIELEEKEAAIIDFQERAFTDIEEKDIHETPTEEKSNGAESVNNDTVLLNDSYIKTDSDIANQKAVTKVRKGFGIQYLFEGHLLRNICVLVLLILIVVVLYFFVKPHYQHSQFEKAIALIEEGKLDEAEPKLKSLAESGYTEAEAHYGQMLIDGSIIKKDLQKGAELLKAAALSGDTLAQTNLSNYYLYINKDVSKALYWGLEAQKKGCIDALTTLVIIYSNGEYPKYNNAEKALYYARMIPDNAPNKEFCMGNAYSCPQLPNYAMAFYWWKKGADKNDSGCFDNLGWLYYYGKGTEIDIVVALSYFMKSLSIQKDNTYALYHVGKIKYDMGNIKESKTYFQKAAELGDEDAQEELSRFELTGSIYE